MAGGFMAYGPSIPDMYRQGAIFVDKILKGAKAGDLPVEQPTKIELVVDLKTAKALGITIPLSLIARADEVDEVTAGSTAAMALFGHVTMSDLNPECERYCCKSLFALLVKNPPGCRRDFRAKMWGTSSLDGKLTGNPGSVIAATQLDGRRSDRLLAGKLSPGSFRLLQHYPNQSGRPPTTLKAQARGGRQPRRRRSQGAQTA